MSENCNKKPLIGRDLPQLRQIVAGLGLPGYAATQIAQWLYEKRVTDIEQMTKLARAMITRYGMSEEFGMMVLETVNNQYMGGDTSLACAAETAAAVDEKVNALLKRQYEKAAELLKKEKQKLHELAKYLYEKETITGEEFMKILQKTEDGE